MGVTAATAPAPQLSRRAGEPVEAEPSDMFAAVAELDLPGSEFATVLTVADADPGTVV